MGTGWEPSDSKWKPVLWQHRHFLAQELSGLERAFWVGLGFFFAPQFWSMSMCCREAVKHLPAQNELVLQKAIRVGPWEGAACGRRGHLLSPPQPSSPGIRFAVVLPGHNVLKQLPAGDPARRRGGVGLIDSTLCPGKPPKNVTAPRMGGESGVQQRDLPSAQLGGPKFGSNPACRKGSGEGEVMSPRGKQGAARGLGDAVNHYSQIKYQVVMALFRDAVMEPHCSRDRRVMGCTWLPPCSLGMPLLPFGHKQELRKGTAGLLVLLLTPAGWGSLLPRGPQPRPQPGAVT